MLLYASRITPRLSYITAFIAGEILTDGITLTTNRAAFDQFAGPKIHYGREEFWPGCFRISNVELLFEKTIVPQLTTCFTTNGFPAFFKTSDGDLHFDLLAASFYLLSRYEEYLPGENDFYGRYKYTRSLAHHGKFLQHPLVNYWLNDLKAILGKRFPQLVFAEKTFQFLPTYDIDIAWSYLHKGMLRNTAGFIRDAAKGRWNEVRKRWQVLRLKESDPFDSYDWMNTLHASRRLPACYFFLVAARKKGYDKNISPFVQAFKTLVKTHEHCQVGIHPSWQSGDDQNLLYSEIACLQELSGKKIIRGRQHYIRFTLPGTYRLLIDAGITEDYSMGYGSINGFRASVASPFYWYDLAAEKQTSLLLYPFCFMDANAYYEQKLSPDEGYRQLLEYYERIKRVEGLMVTIFHNNFLGTGQEFAGWRNMYMKWVTLLCKEEGDPIP